MSGYAGLLGNSAAMGVLADRASRREVVFRPTYKAQPRAAERDLRLLRCWPHVGCSE